MSEHTKPSDIPLHLIALPPMNYIKRYPQANSTPKGYPKTSFILQMMDIAMPPMTNAPSPASSYIFLAFPFIGQKKLNQPMQPIP